MNNFKAMIYNCFDSRLEEKYDDTLRRKFLQYKNICIFGCGNIGLSTLNSLMNKGIKVHYFCDNSSDKVGKVINNVECISISALRKIKNETVVLIATRYYKEIYLQLKELGFSHIDRIFTNKFEIDDYLNNNISYAKEKISKLIDILEDTESKRVVYRLVEEWNTHSYKYGQLDDINSPNQYFPKELINISQDEVFIDGGAYIGDTIEQFLYNCNYNFSKIISFELNKNVYKELNNHINKYDYETQKKIATINKGLSNKESSVYYNDEQEGSQISESGNLIGQITTIDTEMKNEIVSFIKMDIEGSELEALHGAKNTIKNYKPKLAICLYHKPQDLWEIPIYIKTLVPEYKIFIRHHTDLLNETVCYAVL